MAREKIKRKEPDSVNSVMVVERCGFVKHAVGCTKGNVLMIVLTNHIVRRGKSRMKGPQLLQCVCGENNKICLDRDRNGMYYQCAICGARGLSETTRNLAIHAFNAKVRVNTQK